VVRRLEGPAARHLRRLGRDKAPGEILFGPGGLLMLGRFVPFIGVNLQSIRVTLRIDDKDDRL
jgi:hypothetical protein